MEFHPVLHHPFFLVEKEDNLILVFQEQIVLFSALGIILGKHAEVQKKDDEEGNAVEKTATKACRRE